MTPMKSQLHETAKVFGEWNAVVKKEATGETVSNQIYKNLIPTVGRTAMAIQLAANASADMRVTHIAVGSDATAPANGDTILGAEAARKAVGSSANVGVESTIAAFFAAGDATGTHREFGAFGDGNTTTASITSDSGILYSHAAANTIVASDETLTLTFKVTFN